MSKTILSSPCLFSCVSATAHMKRKNIKWLKTTDKIVSQEVSAELNDLVPDLIIQGCQMKNLKNVDIV